MLQTQGYSKAWAISRSDPKEIEPGMSIEGPKYNGNEVEVSLIQATEEYLSRYTNYY